MQFSGIVPLSDRGGAALERATECSWCGRNPLSLTSGAGTHSTVLPLFIHPVYMVFIKELEQLLMPVFAVGRLN